MTADPVLTGSCLCGAATWRFEGDPGSATACNCTACRRYGVLWIYGYEGDGVTTSGPLADYARPGNASLDFRFCPMCGAVVAWRARTVGDDGRRRLAVNLRLADDPDAVQHLPIDHFDGLDSFEDLPRDGRSVRDMWF